jgi:hypothetical protein
VPPSKPEPDIEAILKCLCRHGVDFIVVGGVSAVLMGAPVSTFDLDVVHSREETNLDRLLQALAELDAVYRFPADRRIPPNRSHVQSPGHHLLGTRYGLLDVLGTIGTGRSYEDLLAGTVTVELEPGVALRILGLEAQIQTKEEVGREKDLAVLPVLRRTLRARREGGPNSNPEQAEASSGAG